MANTKALKAQANQQIFEALQSWGLEPQMDGSSVICGLGPLRAKCVDVQISHGGKMGSLLIDLIVDPPTNLVLRENVMQIADSTSQAIGGAVYLWMFSVFVTVAALLDPEGCPGHMAGCDRRIFRAQNGQQRSWKIYSSPFMLMGESDNTEGNRESEQQSDYMASTLPLIEPFLPALCLEPQVYAIKTFLMDSGVNTLHGDCTINGVAAPKMLEALKTFEWPPGEGLRSLRQFHLVASADFGVDMTIPTPQAASPKHGFLGWLRRH